MSPIRHGRWMVVGCLLACLGMVLACSLPGRLLGEVSQSISSGGATEEVPIEITEVPMGEVAAPAAGLAAQVESGQVELVDVVASGEIAGPGMSVVVKNPGTEAITVVIPCGFFFEPDDPGDQRLMVVQEASAVVPAGGEAELTAYVVCIDANSSTPSSGATYRLGTMQSGNLLKLAQCACGEDLSSETSFMQGLGVMVTGWSISEGIAPEDMAVEGAEGAMGDMFSSGMGDLLEMFGTVSGDWFEKCEIPRP